MPIAALPVDQDIATKIPTLQPHARGYHPQDLVGTEIGLR